MNRFLTYWSPALAWMGFIFPLFNRSLGSPKIWQIFSTIMLRLFPDASDKQLSVAYIGLRKTWHFLEYAILAVLLYRALRAGRAPRWQRPRALAAGLAAWGYGLLDEFLQSFAPGRKGSPLDWAIDTTGLLAGLALVYLWAKRQGPDG